jgi:hypothetical protein
LSVPPPEFDTWNVWLEAFAPWTQEGDREAGFLEMAADPWAFTVRWTGMVWGVLLAPVAAMVMVAE